MPEIELSSIEATAYWWINMIKNKVRELSIQGTNDKNERAFLTIFYQFTEIEWRNLYLGLIDCITEDVNNYVPRGFIDLDAFNQDTDESAHDRLNAELAKILNCHIPDIRLASNSSKDFVIYTNMFGASVWYKSCGVMPLSHKYEPSFILTGNKDELDFYNLIITTMAIIDEIDHSFNSIPLLRARFCEAYQSFKQTDAAFDTTIADFNRLFDKACDNDIVYGRHWKPTYFLSFREIDFIGLEEYYDTAERFAHVILQRKPDEPVFISRRLKRNNTTN